MSDDERKKQEQEREESFLIWVLCLCYFLMGAWTAYFVCLVTGATSP